MGGFKRAFLGYRRTEVDAALTERGGRIAELEKELPRIGELQRALASSEAEAGELSAMVIERERDNRELREELRRLQDRQSGSLASLEALSERLEDVQAQARGQATRIRMKALREAVEVSRRVQELSGRIPAGAESAGNGGGNGLRTGPASDDGDAPATRLGDPEAANGEVVDIGEETAAQASAAAAGTPAQFQGTVRVDIGPLGDFSQLVGFEDAAGQITATSQISVERFSGGRATLAMSLDEPVELLRELEQRCPLSFGVRHAAADYIVLDVDVAASAAHRAA